MKQYRITVNGVAYDVAVEELGEGASAPAAPIVTQTAAPAAAQPAPAGTVGGTAVTSPMPGTILKVNVTVGQAVKKGDVLCVLEAMKMENDIPAPNDGTVASVNVTKGASVQSGDALITLR